MPTVFTHPAAAMLKTWFPDLPARAFWTGAVATVVADLDVAAFAVGIPYEDTFGHRGFSHSFAFAAIVAVMGTLLLRTKPHRLATFVFLFACSASHPLLDALTDGGLGVAFFSPWSNVRYFFPWRPIRVSPIGPRFFSDAGLRVMVSELLWVWLPCAAVASIGKYVMKVEREVGKKR